MARGEPFRETLANAYFLRDDFDPRTYPAARTKRTGPPLSGAPGTATEVSQAGAAPRTRAFWFELRTNANTRTTISTPRLQGPVVVKHVTWGAGGGSSPDAGNWFLDIGKAPTAVAEVNVGVLAARNWVSLFSDMVPRSANVTAGLTGMPSKNIFGGAGDDLWPVNQLVTDPEFFLVLSVLNNVAATRVTHGTIYLVENVPLTDAAFYLG